jgi:hypothetical protein
MKEELKKDFEQDFEIENEHDNVLFMKIAPNLYREINNIIKKEKFFY